jgi:SAM-dependent methyltransferase
MNPDHLDSLRNDLLESENPEQKFVIWVKRVYYFFEGLTMHPILKTRLNNRLRTADFPMENERFILNEGGMFKSKVYAMCNKESRLRDADILVPGIGYGHNIFQLATFRPRRIVGFDLYEYPEEWTYMRKEVKEKFGVELVFLKGGFPSLPDEYKNSFDVIISDAVLEHVKDVKAFMESSGVFLKKNGAFYASFGPIWYGPDGDHIDWGRKDAFRHLIDSEGDYRNAVMAEKKKGRWEIRAKEYLCTGKSFFPT